MSREMWGCCIGYIILKSSLAIDLSTILFVIPVVHHSYYDFPLLLLSRGGKSKK
jgi:hypothetical protein